MRLLFVLVFLIQSFLLAGQSSIEHAAPETPLFYPSKVPVEMATFRAEDTQGMTMDWASYKSLRDTRPGRMTWELHFPGLGLVSLELSEFCNLSDDFTIARSTAEGTREEHYVPNLMTYEVTSAAVADDPFDEAQGIVVLFENFVQASFKVQGTQWELAPTKRPGHRQEMVDDYVLFDVSKSAATNTFTCAVEDQEREMTLLTAQQQRNLVPQCVEIGLDIDNFTYNTFSDCYGAIDWGLGVLAGVDLVYRTELNDFITLQASYVNVWEVPEPWANTVNNAGTMLDQLRSEWTSSNAVLANANWDMVHLMTKRNDTGTGGIAYLGVVCSQSNACAFSSAMDNQSNFPVIPPNFTWNLFVVAHELGHNFGANHTHWCGWPGGPDHPDEPSGSSGTIHDCYDSEGGCNEPVINEQGTIMSYCHLQPAGAILQFHPVVEQAALFPTINANGFCHGNCAAIETSCGSYGCTDPSACNFDPSAVQDDGSCGVIDECGVCAGLGASCTGCTDPLACNFFEDALFDDGSCSYPPPGYPCDCVTAISATADLTANASSTTTTEAIGTLTTADITLIWTNTAGDGSWAGDLLLEIGAPDGSCVGIGGYDIGTGCSLGSLPWPSAWNVSASGTYTHSVDLTSLGMTGDGDWSLNLINGWTSSGGANYNVSVDLNGVCSGEPAFSGCTDVEACNYDETATLDDGSCDLGTAAYFDSDGDGFGQYLAQYFCGDVVPAGTVTVDGDCNDANSTIYPGAPGTAQGIDNNCNGVIDPDEEEAPPCPEDVNGDGTISVADVLAVLSEFGCTGADCQYDIDGDNAVTVSDVLMVLSAFGDSCL